MLDHIEITPITRVVVGVTVIVAFAAIFYGIRDYVGQRKEVKAAVTTSTPDVNSAVVQRKTTEAKRKGRKSSTGRSVAATALATADAPTDTMSPTDAMQHSGITEEFDNAGTQAIPVPDSAPTTAAARGGHVQIGAGPAKCLPLPNVVKPGDVDAHYYKNWAREYSCLI